MTHKSSDGWRVEGREVTCWAPDWAEIIPAEPAGILTLRFVQAQRFNSRLLTHTHTLAGSDKLTSLGSPEQTLTDVEAQERLNGLHVAPLPCARNSTGAP